MIVLGDTASVLRKVMTFLVITFSVFLLIAAVLFVLDSDQKFIGQLITIAVACIGLTALHFWAPSVEDVSNPRYRTLVYGFLLFEYLLSVVVLILLQPS